MKKYFILLAAFGLTACEEQQSRSAQADIGLAKAEAAMSKTKTNGEIDNIANRLTLTGDPNLLGHIAIVNKVGQVVLYTTIKGKITSGSKRLTNPSACGANIGDCPNDEGTYGSSNPYVFFWTTQGQYIQTSMDYIYSDKPLRLDEKPLMAIPTTPERGE